MALLGPSTDYTDKDFDALRARLFLLIRSIPIFSGWTDEDVANFGNLLVESFAFVGDVLTKYQDNQAAEAFWGRVTQRKNIVALAKRMGFRPRGNTASTAELTLTITSGPPAGRVPLPERTRAKTESVVDPVVYETTAAIEFPAGFEGPLVVGSENAERREELFTASSRPNQEIRLAGSPFLDGTLELSAANGAYTVVDDFLDSTSTDRHVTVSIDQNDRAVVRFGNGASGQLPSGTITARYRRGGGAAGVVEPGRIVKLESSFADEFGNPVRIAVTNASRSTPALDRQTVEQIRALAPATLRVLTRTVAREDYEINALRVAGVARALMLTSDQDPAVAENAGLLFIVPEGGGVPSEDLKAAVLTMVTETFPNTITFDAEVRDPVYLTVDVSTRVHFVLGTSSSGKVQVAAAIRAALEDAFAISQADGTPTPGIDFGYALRDPDGTAGSIAWSDVFNVVRDTAGVRKIDDGADGLLLNGESDDLPIDLREFPILGTVTIIDASTGLPVA